MENALALCACTLVPLLPRRAITWLACGLGHAVFLLDRRQRRVAQANLELAFGNTLSDAEKTRIMRVSLQTFILALLDGAWFTRNPRKRLQRWVKLGEDAAATVLVDKPQILITGHYGNWELLGHATAVAGHPLHSVAATVENPFVNRTLTRMRQRLGQVVVPQKGAIRHLLAILKSGRKVGLLLDQNSRPSHGGLFVPFFGVEVPMSGIVARMALKTGVDIIVGFSYPQPDGTYLIDKKAVISQDSFPKNNSEEAARELTGLIAEALESAIREKPEFWLWSYKRWKLIAPGSDPAQYPFYSHPIRVGDT